MKDQGKKQRFDQLDPGERDVSSKDLKDIRQTFEKLLDEDIQVPAGLDEKFYSSLERESDRKRKISRIMKSSSFRSAVRVAAGITLFILGWMSSGIIETRVSDPSLLALSEEMSELKESLILTMLSKDSPGERIQAVSMVNEIERPDNEIIMSMISVMNNDPNDNVRLVALETLTAYISYPEVREGLIHSITMQSSPIIQLRLAEIMRAIQEKKAVPEFRKLLENPMTTDYSVRQELSETVAMLL